MDIRQGLVSLIEGKSAEEIETIIHNLNQEIENLKAILARPDYVCTICPGEDVQLAMSVEYLERAKQALAAAGGTYIPTK